jgi:hypothetical protein
MLIGRNTERERLLEAYRSEYSEFVAVYGRRRVGKTFLVRETFDYKFTFSHAGIYKKNTRGQLQEFYKSLRRHGAEVSAVPKDWSEAFDMLMSFLDKSKDKRKVVFIDELPWMDAPRSSFVSALEHFWNSWASARKDILLIVCGSASSWIVNKIFRNHGGLHNRVSVRIHLSQFTLRECELYAQALKLRYSREQITEAYMIVGGVPYYWSKMRCGMSLAQNIDALFFARDGEFSHEFNDLYASLFTTPEKYVKVIDALGSKKKGLTREEILKTGKLEDSGNVSKMLDNLEYCGFIRKYFQIGHRRKNAIYQLIDNYTLFYYQFVKGKTSIDGGYWSKTIGKAGYYAWSGLAFERVCLIHSSQIKKALGISGVLTSEYSWSVAASESYHGAQIDLLIDRGDGVIDICEMKYSKSPFAITADYRRNLLNKIDRFQQTTRTKKAIHLVMISANGLADTENNDVVNNVVTLDALFAD